MSRRPLARSVHLALETLEDRTTPTFLPHTGAGQIGVNGANVQTGGLSIAVGDLLPDTGVPPGGVVNEYVTGTGPGVNGLVRVWRQNGQANGQGVPELTINPFPGFTGGINVAVGDVLGDGDLEIIAAVAGNGPPHVKVYSAGGQLLSSFLAFDAGFLGGVNVAVGNVLGGISGGGFSGGTISSSFKQEIIIGAAAGTAPHIVVASGAGSVLRSFLAFDLGYRGGVTVAAASIDTTRTAAYSVTGVDTNAYDEIIVGAATDFPHVKAFEVWTGAITERLSFLAFDSTIRGGVTVAAGSTDNGPGAEIFVSQVIPRNIPTPPIVRTFNGGAQLLASVAPFPANYTHVLNMTVGFLKGAYDPSDDDSVPGNNSLFFLTQDLTIVTGDGPFNQQPRLLAGLIGSPAGANGP